MNQVSSNSKVKTRPPPLQLFPAEQPFHDETAISINESPFPGYVEHDSHDDHHEFDVEFEGTLMGLLNEDELLPFNIHTAASLGNTASVRHLIERCNVDPNSKNSGDWTAIMYASLFSHSETVLYLLEMKADVNMKNPNGKTPLMLASVCGSEETIRILLMHGAILEERDHEDFTALMLAIAATHCESANILLDYGADPNVRERIHGQTPLYIAAQTGQFGIAQALIQLGVDVDVKTSSGDTAHHAALRNGYPSIAKLIAERQEAQAATSNVAIASCRPSSVAAPTEMTSRPAKPTFLDLAPTQYRPKSPYSTFFDRLPDPKPLEVPEVVVQDMDSGKMSEAQWFPSPGDLARCSPEGVESAGLVGQPDTFNLFSAWPGASLILKQAVPAAVQQNKSKFKKSISKPVRTSKLTPTTTPITPASPWSPFQYGERLPVLGQRQSTSSSSAGEEEVPTVKLPKDLSSVLADLGLTKYQMHFEEQDIDLQVFLTMNEADLREIGINSLGARRKCLSTIEYYQTRTNYYRISEEFMVNTWVSKRDLADLKLAWGEMAMTVAELRAAHSRPAAGVPTNAVGPTGFVVDRLSTTGSTQLVDRLVKQMKRAESFFLKY